MAKKVYTVNQVWKLINDHYSQLDKSTLVNMVCTWIGEEAEKNKNYYEGLKRELEYIDIDTTDVEIVDDNEVTGVLYGD